MEALKSFETRGDDVILTIFPKMSECPVLDEEITAAVQECMTAHNRAITPMAG